MNIIPVIRGVLRWLRLTTPVASLLEEVVADAPGENVGSGRAKGLQEARPVGNHKRGIDPKQERELVEDSENQRVEIPKKLFTI